jgi:hypothetical protein
MLDLREPRVFIGIALNLHFKKILYVKYIYISLAGSL